MEIYIFLILEAASSDSSFVVEFIAQPITSSEMQTIPGVTCI